MHVMLHRNPLFYRGVARLPPASPAVRPRLSRPSECWNSGLDATAGGGGAARPASTARLRRHASTLSRVSSTGVSRGLDVVSTTSTFLNLVCLSGRRRPRGGKHSCEIWRARIEASIAPRAVPQVAELDRARTKRERALLVHGFRPLEEAQKSPRGRGKHRCSTSPERFATAVALARTRFSGHHCCCEAS